jgi:hypothetical protein
LTQSAPLEQPERQPPPLQLPLQQSPLTEQELPSPEHWFEE